MCHASKERVLVIGTDQRITSGPAARTAAFRGRIHGCTRTLRANVRFLGAAIFGAEGGEVMTVIHVAMMGNLPYTALRDAALSHPTLAEGLTKLFAVLDG
jgi:pyruvate/2-oxoglutarate dehydrogenase complex dihydrolipoamide dehydrogenase (E3) component